MTEIIDPYSLPGEHVTVDYMPQPKQQLLSSCPANEILFGGSAGPGKSYSIRHEALILATKVPKLNVYIFRRTYPELEKNHILPIITDWGNKYGTWNGGDKRYYLPNQAILHFCHAQHEKSVMNYHGAEIGVLIIDELSTFTEFQYVYLRNRVRTTIDVPPQLRHKIPGIICGSNPGGPGHEFCKRLFVDYCRIDSTEANRRKENPAASGPVYDHPHRRLGSVIYYGLKKAPAEEGGMLRAYIPALLEDNKILMKKDPGYINRVKAMPEPYRSAYLDGDWEIFLGQMFSFNRRYHVCEPHPIPKHAPIYFCFDWGFGAPFACCWNYVDADNRLFLFGELYGWTGQPNQGLRKSDSEIAEMIIEKEIDLGLRTKNGGAIVNGFDVGRVKMKVGYILSPDCFSKKPNYQGGGQGKSTSEVFNEYGINGTPGDPTRNQKIKQFHERLRIPRDPKQAPMLQVFDTCKQFIRTIPLLQQDEHDPEDIDSSLEDHLYDAEALVMMARPLSLEIPPEAKGSVDRRLDELEAGNQYDDTAELMNNQLGQVMTDLDGSEWDHLGDEAEYDDGNMVSTVG